MTLYFQELTHWHALLVNLSDYSYRRKHLSTFRLFDTAKWNPFLIPPQIILVNIAKNLRSKLMELICDGVSKEGEIFVLGMLEIFKIMFR